jgi:excisionase family DNA binding protein
MTRSACRAKAWGVVMERITDDDVLLTFKEAEEYLRVSRATVYRLLWSGQLVGHKVGKGWRFFKADLRKLVLSAGNDALPGAPAIMGLVED